MPTFPNEYDMTWLPNFRQHLGSRMWMWLLPYTEEMKGKGFYYPKIPELSMSDLNVLHKDSSKIHNTSLLSFTLKTLPIRNASKSNCSPD